LPEIFNRLAESRTTGSYWKLFYSASIKTPFGDGYSDSDKIEGFHFCLTIIFEPISQEAEVINHTATFIVDDETIRNIVFQEEMEQIVKEDLPLNQQNCERLLTELREFCQRALPDVNLASLEID
jgi:hypothetical protein